jgi:hypothetical protein
LVRAAREGMDYYVPDAPRAALLSDAFGPLERIRARGPAGDVEHEALKLTPETRGAVLSGRFGPLRRITDARGAVLAQALTNAPMRDQAPQARGEGQLSPERGRRARPITPSTPQEIADLTRRATRFAEREDANHRFDDAVADLADAFERAPNPRRALERAEEDAFDPRTRAVFEAVRAEAPWAQASVAVRKGMARERRFTPYFAQGDRPRRSESAANADEWYVQEAWGAFDQEWTAFQAALEGLSRERNLPAGVTEPVAAIAAELDRELPMIPEALRALEGEWVDVVRKGVEADPAWFEGSRYDSPDAAEEVVREFFGESFSLREIFTASAYSMYAEDAVLDLELIAGRFSFDEGGAPQTPPDLAARAQALLDRMGPWVEVWRNNNNFDWQDTPVVQGIVTPGLARLRRNIDELWDEWQAGPGRDADAAPSEALKATDEALADLMAAFDGSGGERGLREFSRPKGMRFAMEEPSAGSAEAVLREFGVPIISARSGFDARDLVLMYNEGLSDAQMLAEIEVGGGAVSSSNAVAVRMTLVRRAVKKSMQHSGGLERLARAMAVTTDELIAFVEAAGPGKSARRVPGVMTELRRLMRDGLDDSKELATRARAYAELHGLREPSASVIKQTLSHVRRELGLTRKSGNPLPAQQREEILQRLRSGERAAKAAADMGVPIYTVRNILARARGKGERFARPGMGRLRPSHAAAEELEAEARETFGSAGAALIDNGVAVFVNRARDIPLLVEARDGRLFYSPYMTQEEVRRLSRRAVREAVAQGALSEVPAEVAGLSLDGKTYFIAANFAPERLRALMLHEIGVHHGMKAMLGEKHFDALIAKVEARVTKAREAANPSGADQFWRNIDDHVRSFYEDFYADYADGEPAIWEEVIASVVEGAEEEFRNVPEAAMRNVFQRMFDALRRWAVTTLGIGEISARDLHGLALASLRRSAREVGVGAGGARAARGDKAGFSTVAEFEARALQEFGEDWRKLAEAGRVEVVQHSREAGVGGVGVGRGSRGVTVRGDSRSVLIANNVRPDQVRGLLLHEVGVHQGMKDMLGARGFANVLKQLDDLVAAGDPAATRAREQAEQSGALPEDIGEETLAYLVEDEVESPLKTDLFARLRRWMIKTFGTTFGARLTVADLQALALASLRQSSRGAGSEPRFALSDKTYLGQRVNEVVGEEYAPERAAEAVEAFINEFSILTQEFDKFARASNAPGGMQEALGAIDVELKKLNEPYIPYGARDSLERVDRLLSDQERAATIPEEVRLALEALRDAYNADLTSNKTWLQVLAENEQELGAAFNSMELEVAGLDIEDLPQSLAADLKDIVDNSYSDGIIGDEALRDARPIFARIRRNLDELWDEWNAAQGQAVAEAEARLGEGSDLALALFRFDAQLRDAIAVFEGAGQDHGGLRVFSRPKSARFALGGPRALITTGELRRLARARGHDGQGVARGAFEFLARGLVDATGRGADYRKAGPRGPREAGLGEMAAGNTLAVGVAAPFAVVAATEPGREERRQQAAELEREAMKANARAEGQGAERAARATVAAAIEARDVMALPDMSEKDMISRETRRAYVEGLAEAVGEMAGIEPALLVAIVDRETARTFDPGAANPGSTAVGFGQFIKSTWRREIARSARAYGVDIEGLDSAAILELRRDPRIALAMLAAHTRENVDVLGARLGREVSGGEAYAAHFFGVERAAAFIRAADAGMSADETKIEFAREARVNRHVFVQSGRALSAREVMAALEAEFGSEPLSASLAAPTDQDAADVQPASDNPMPEPVE